MGLQIVAHETIKCHKYNRNGGAKIPEQVVMQSDLARDVITKTKELHSRNTAT